MDKRQPQSKIIRHEMAKQRYKSFQRSISVNSSKQMDPVPCPGQYVIHEKVKNDSSDNILPKAIKGTSSEAIKFTKNIKLILKQKSTHPTTEIISNIVNQKISTKYQSMKNLVNKQQSKLQNTHSKSQLRPISAEIFEQLGKNALNQSRFIKQAYEFDKQLFIKKQYQKKNTFMVKSRINYPKHIQGYHMMNVDEDLAKKYHRIKVNKKQTLIIQNPSNNPQSFKQLEAKFLPIQYYIFQDEPQKLLEKYANKDTGYTYGESKWFDLEGKYIWKSCKIIEFDKKQQRWVIEWLHNSNRKKVSRNNLMFSEEDRSQYEKMILEAQQIRKKNEIYMMYNWMVDTLKTDTHELEKEKEIKILQLTLDGKLRFMKKEIKNIYVTKTVNLIPEYLNSLKPSLTVNFYKLIMEMRNIYSRANHQAQFNGTLPFNEQRKVLFQNYLPSCMFVPNEQHKAITYCNIKIQSKDKFVLKKYFRQNLQNFRQKSSLANPFKLKILQMLNASQVQLRQKVFFKMVPKYYQLEISSFKKTEKLMTLNELALNFQKSIRELFYVINCKICDLQHLVGLQLDPLYLDKKSIGQQSFNKIVETNKKFLYLIDFRMQGLISQILKNTLMGLIDHFRKSNEEYKFVQFQGNKFKKYTEKQSLVSGIKVKINLQYKQNQFVIEPSISQINKFFQQILEQLFEKISDIKCISKSYLQDGKETPKLKIITEKNQRVLKPQFQAIKLQYEKQIVQTFTHLQNYVKQVEKITSSVPTQAFQSKKRIQKKGTYAEVEQTIEQILKLNELTNSILHKDRFTFLFFHVNCEQVRMKCQNKINQTMKDTYKLLLERIMKENQKIQKSIENIIETLKKQPKNIEQMQQLQIYASKTVPEELERINQKVNFTATKVSILQKTCLKMDYKDFENCFSIYMNPLKILKRVEDCQRGIEYIHKKTFGEQLTQQAVNLLQQIKEIQNKVHYCTQVKSLKEMDSNFSSFQKVSDKLDQTISRAKLINYRQKILKWQQTNFQALDDMKEIFDPYFKLITIFKNYSYHIESQKLQPFNTLNSEHILHEVENGFKTLEHLQKDVFGTNPIMLQIVNEVIEHYRSFRCFLPLIKALRNQDMRERHWTLIKELTDFHSFQNQSLTLKEIIDHDINSYISQLSEISQIATKQLIYEKQLNKIKKQWKQLRIFTAFYIQQPAVAAIRQGQDEIAKKNLSFLQNLKIVANVQIIKQKIENDMFNIQNILATNFVKFLEFDIINWRNNVLYKAQEFVDHWEKSQQIIIHIWSTFSHKKIIEQLPNQLNKFKTIEKAWKLITSHIESQPAVVQLLQTKMTDNLLYLFEISKELYKQVLEYFDKKKQINCRLTRLSNNEIFEMFATNGLEQANCLNRTIKKCFSAVFSVVRSDQIIAQKVEKQRFSIIGVINHLQEKVLFNQQISQEMQKANKELPDETLQWIQKAIKHQLKEQLVKKLNNKETKTISQIQELYQEIMFTYEVQFELRSNKTLQDYQKRLRQRYVDSVSKFHENQSNLNFAFHNRKVTQLLNHINIVELLIKSQIKNSTQFEWQSQTRAYINPTYTKQKIDLFVNIGPYCKKYEFNIVDCSNFVLTPNLPRQFFTLISILNCRNFPSLEGKLSVGKKSSIRYLSQLFGKELYEVYCNNSLDESSCLDYLKICSAGFWILFHQINNSSKQFISTLSVNLQTLWNSYKVCTKKFCLKIDNFETSCEWNNFAMFINHTIHDSQSYTKTPQSLKNYFRSIAWAQPTFREFVNMKLGLLFSNETSQYASKIEAICNEVTTILFVSQQQTSGIVSQLIMNNQTNNKIVCSSKLKIEVTENKVINSFYFNKYEFLKIFIQELKNLSLQNKYTKITSLLFKLSFQAALKKYFIFKPLISGIVKHLQTYFQFCNSIKSEKQDKQEIKKTVEEILIRQKLYFNEDVVETIVSLIDIITYNKATAIVCQSSYGKSTLIDLLTKIKNLNFMISLDKFNPLSLSFQQLYGAKQTTNYFDLKMDKKAMQASNDIEGIFNLFLQNLAKKGQSEENQQHRKYNGIVLDANIGSCWCQPIMPVLQQNQKKYTQNNGNTISLHQNTRLIFQCTNTSNCTPSFLTQLYVMSLQYTIKWQNMFMPFVLRNFPQKYHTTKVLNALQAIIPCLVDPAIQFYQSNNDANKKIVTLKDIAKKEQNTINCQAPIAKKIIKKKLLQPNELVQIILKMFLICLEDYFGKKYQFETLELAEISDIFNILIFSIVWTLGLILPQHNQKSFSRHFKYLIKRGIQLSLRAIDKQTLPKEQQCVFDIYYRNGKWQYWNDPDKHIEHLTSFGLNNCSQIVLPENLKFMYLIHMNIKYNRSFCFIGKPSRSKNTLLMQFLELSSKDRFHKIKLCLSPHSEVSEIKSIIKQSIEKQKYSKLIPGFVNGKTTLFYICDLNMPSIQNKENPIDCSFSYITEFFRQFYSYKGWYLEDDLKLKLFKNLIIFATINSELILPKRLFCQMNPIQIPSNSENLETILKNVSENQLQNYTKNFQVYEIMESLMKCSRNLHAVISRQYQDKLIIKLNNRDIQKICKTTIRLIGSIVSQEKQKKMVISSHLKGQILKRWIFVSETVYSQKLSHLSSEQLFYLINNVLMQEQRQRYKIIYEDNNVVFTNLLTKQQFQEVTAQQLERQIKNVLLHIQTQSEKQDYYLSIIAETDSFSKHLAYACNGFTNDSITTFCFKKEEINLAPLGKILAYLKNRLFIEFKPSNSSYKEGKIEWYQFVKQDLSQIDFDKNQVILFIKSNEKQTQQQQQISYILDDIYSLLRIDVLPSFQLAEKKKQIEDNEVRPQILLKPSKIKQNLQSTNKKFKQSQKNKEFLQKTNSNNSKNCKIWFLLQFKNFDQKSINQYQALLAESTILWMTDKISQSNYQISKKMIMDDSKKMAQEQIENTCFQSWSIDNNLIPDIKQLAIKIIENNITATYPFLVYLNETVFTHISKLKFYQTYLKFEYLKSSIKIFTQVYTNYYMGYMKKINETYHIMYLISSIKKITQKVEEFNFQLKNKIQNKKRELVDMEQMLELKGAQYNNFKKQHSEIAHSIDKKQYQHKELKHIYGQQTKQTQLIYQKCRDQLINAIIKVKKILMTNQMKIILEIFAIAIGRKKDDQDTVKEMLKQINNQKINKKLVSFQPYHVIDKNAEKAKNMIEKLEKSKNVKQSNTDAISVIIKRFITSLICAYQKHKKMEIQWNKANEKIKQAENLKVDLQRKMKSKNYLDVLEKYEKFSRRIQKQTQTLDKMSKKTLVYESIFGKLSNLQVNLSEIQKKLKQMTDEQKSFQKQILSISISITFMTKYQHFLKDLTHQKILKIMYQNEYLYQPKMSQTELMKEVNKYLNIQILQSIIQLDESLDNKIELGFQNQTIEWNFKEKIDIKTLLSYLPLSRQDLAKIKNKGYSVKRLFKKLLQIRGFVLLQKNPSLSEWVQNLFIKQRITSSAFLAQKNTIDDKNLKKQAASRIMVPNCKQKSNYRFIKVGNEAQLKKILQLPCYQLKQQKNQTIILYYEEFSDLMKSMYPYIKITQISFEEIVQICENVIQQKKNSELELQQQIYKLNETNQNLFQSISNKLDQLHKKLTIRIFQVSSTGSQEIVRRPFRKKTKSNKSEENSSRNRKQQPIKKEHEGQKQIQTPQIAIKIKQQPIQEHNYIFENQEQQILENLTILQENIKSLTINKQTLQEKQQNYKQAMHSRASILHRAAYFCSRMYLLAQYFSKDKLFLANYTFQRYLKLLKEILQRQKEKGSIQKNRITNFQKAQMILKKGIYNDLLWREKSNTGGNNTLPFLFLLAGLEDWSQMTIIKALEWAMNKKFSFIPEKLTIETTNQEIINEQLYIKSGKRNPYISKKLTLTNLFYLTINEFQQFHFEFNQIIADIQKRQARWVQFFLTINEKTIRLIEPFQTKSQIYLLIFLTMFNESALKSWFILNNSDSQLIWNNQSFSHLKNIPQQIINPNIKPWAIINWNSQNAMKRLFNSRYISQNNIIILTSQLNDDPTDKIAPFAMISSFARLSKKNLNIILDKKIENIGEQMQQIIKNGGWAFYDCAFNSQQTLQKIGSIYKHSKQLSLVHNQFTLWISCDNFTNSAQQFYADLYFAEHCLMNLSNYGKMQITPSTFYSIINQHKRTIKQYNQLPSENKQGIYKLLAKTNQACKIKNQQFTQQFSQKPTYETYIADLYDNIQLSLFGKQNKRRSTVIQSITTQFKTSQNFNNFILQEPFQKNKEKMIRGMAQFFLRNLLTNHNVNGRLQKIYNMVQSNALYQSSSQMELSQIYAEFQQNIREQKIAISQKHLIIMNTKQKCLCKSINQNSYILPMIICQLVWRSEQIGLMEFIKSPALENKFTMDNIYSLTLSQSCGKINSSLKSVEECMKIVHFCYILLQNGELDQNIQIGYGFLEKLKLLMKPKQANPLQFFFKQMKDLIKYYKQTESNSVYIRQLQENSQSSIDSSKQCLKYTLNLYQQPEKLIENLKRQHAERMQWDLDEVTIIFTTLDKNMKPYSSKNNSQSMRPQIIKQSKRTSLKLKNTFQPKIIFSDFKLFKAKITSNGFIYLDSQLYNEGYDMLIQFTQKDIIPLNKETQNHAMYKCPILIRDSQYSVEIACQNSQALQDQGVHMII